jgi:competence protein ComFC
MNAIRKITEVFLDIIWPPACPVCGDSIPRGQDICVPCATLLSAPVNRCILCGAELLDHSDQHTCDPLPAHTSCVIIASDYEDSQHAIHAFKYRSNTVVGEFLAERLAMAVSEHERADDISLVIPVPIHRARQRERGYNQAELPATSAAKMLDIPMRTDLLVRTRDTGPQVGLDAGGRRRNVSGAFEVSDAVIVAGLTILLVDDVITTGATMSECADVLLQAGAESVIAAAIARPRPSMRPESATV